MAAAEPVTGMEAVTAATETVAVEPVVVAAANGSVGETAAATDSAVAVVEPVAAATDSAVASGCGFAGADTCSAVHTLVAAWDRLLELQMVAGGSVVVR